MIRPPAVEIVEVGPRDGLQNEAVPVDVGTRVALIEGLVAAGLRRIEAGSFVSPKWVPQMAGTAEVMAGVPRRPGVAYSVLVPNERGLADALAARPDEIAVFAAASETFSQRNLNASISQSFERFAPVAAEAGRHGIPLRGYVSCVLGCPYEGAVATSAVVDVSRRLVDLGAREVSLGDTIGVGTPLAAQALVRAVAEAIGIDRIALHFHDTFGQALANVLACLELGVTIVDSAVAGLGGCPYAKGASGNLATEDLVYMLDGMGVETGVDLDRLAAAGRTITAALGRPPASRVAAALAARSSGDT